MAGNLPLPTFLEWKDAQSLRNEKVGSQVDVDLSGEPALNYFYASTLQTILNAKPASIVFRFGCSDAKNLFKTLEVAVQARDASDKTILTFLSHKVLGTGIDEKDPATWPAQEDNFKQRNAVINAQGYSADYQDERGGIRHAVADFEAWFKTITAGELAAYFIYDADKTSVALVDSSFIMDGAKAAAAAPPSIYDQGNKCCP